MSCIEIEQLNVPYSEIELNIVPKLYNVPCGKQSKEKTVKYKKKKKRRRTRKIEKDIEMWCLSYKTIYKVSI